MVTGKDHEASCFSLPSSGTIALSPRIEKVRLAINTSNNTIATIISSASMCGEAAVCRFAVNVGMASAANANNIKVAIIFGDSELNFCVPFFKPPNNKAKPNTNKELPRIEPTNAACTTLSKPARKAKIATNNSGKFPNADCSIPVGPGPMRLPNCSVAWPTIIARNTKATAVKRKSNTELISKYVAIPANAVAEHAAIIVMISFLVTQVKFNVQQIKELIQQV